jgi:L-threonylcarbamoyladenylate synthase
MTSTVDDAAAALRAGELAIVPMDTVYGLVARADAEAAARKLAEAKGRDEAQPIALVARDLELLLQRIPELDGRAGAIARALLPGPYTLVLPNPARRFRWLAASRPETIGVRVPELPAEARDVVERVGAVAATSANPHGARDPRRVDEIPDELRAAVAAVVDAGELPGTPSTVVDLTGPEPVVLREGAVSARHALARVDEALARRRTPARR